MKMLLKTSTGTNDWKQVQVQMIRKSFQIVTKI